MHACVHLCVCVCAQARPTPSLCVLSRALLLLLLLLLLPQHEDARRYQMTIAAEDAAAQAAVRKELMAAQLAAEDQATKVGPQSGAQGAISCMHFYMRLLLCVRSIP